MRAIYLERKGTTDGTVRLSILGLALTLISLGFATPLLVVGGVFSVPIFALLDIRPRYVSAWFCRGTTC